MIQPPRPLCPYPKASGSIKLSIIIAFIITLIPTFYHLINMYGFSFNIILELPTAFISSIGVIFGYYEMNISTGILHFIIIGLFIGISSASIKKATISTFLFVIMSLVLFLLIGLMALGLDIDYSRFSLITTKEYILTLLYILIPAIIASIIIQSILTPSNNPNVLKVTLPNSKSKKKVIKIN